MALPPNLSSRVGGPKGMSHYKSTHAALAAKSANLPPPPAQFDPAKQYRVRLNRVLHATPPPDTSHPLRPSDDVIVSGDFANANADAIVGAEELP